MASLPRLLGRLTVGLLSLVVLAVGAVYGISSWRLSRPVEIPDGALVPALASDSAVIARGEHLVRSIAKCVDCHGDDLGGRYFIDEPAIARLYAPNLTRGAGSRTVRYTDQDWDRAVRHGADPSRRALLYMLSEDYQHLSDRDLAAIVSYLRRVTPVDREDHASSVGPVARALYVAGKLPLKPAELISHAALRRAEMEPSDSREYGEYIAKVGGCIGCHGAKLAGGPIPGAPPEFPPAANLTPGGIKHYDEAAFFRAMREGKRPDGSAIRLPMPISATKLMTDDETRAVWRYLRSLPAAEYGHNH